MSREQPLSPKQSPSLGRLARRISAWTTNGLITVMLVVIALGFGRVVLHWWHDEAPVPAAAPLAADDFQSDGAPHVLKVGDQPWAIKRQEFSGRLRDVSAALQTACRAALSVSRPRGSSPDAAEQLLLQRLAAERPVAEEPGQWRLYRWGDDHPIFLGTRAVVDAVAKGKQEGIGVHLDQDQIGPMRPIGPIGPMSPTSLIRDDAKPGTNLDKTPYRVVVWGIAIPSAADGWTLYLFQSQGAAGSQSPPGVAIPLPPAGRRLMAIRADGGAVIAFALGDCDTARRFYERWFADYGWIVAQDWQQIGSGWQARFEIGSAGAQSAATQSAAARAVDIRLSVDRQGQWTGLLLESKLQRGKP